LLLYAYDLGSALHLKLVTGSRRCFLVKFRFEPLQMVGALLRIVTDPALRGERFHRGRRPSL
jgi:hypothetical protein